MYSLEIKPIQVETIEEHEKELSKRLIHIQLCFADEKFKKIKKRKETLKFSDVLKKYTSIFNLIRGIYREYYYQRHRSGENNFEKKDVEQKIKEEIEKMLEKIESIYQDGQDGWQEEISQLIIKIEKEFKIPQEVLGEFYQRKKVGLFEYEAIESAKEKLNRFGFSDLSKFVQIHFPDFYKTSGKNITPMQIRQSLEDLAVIIINRFPEAEGVVGKSWLMDSALAEKLGFKILEKKKRLNDTSTWGQLKDKKGQINRVVLEKILETNELPYKVTLGIIGIEDFLREYLPQNKRGKITLKRLKEKSNEQYADVKKSAQEFRLKFDGLTENEIEPCLRQNEILSNWLDTEDGALFLRLLKEGKRAKMNMQEFFESKKEETKDMNKRFEKFIKSIMYEDVEIII